jgi:hypothetical protein
VSRIQSPLRNPKSERERGQALLRAIVEVAFDPLPLTVSRRHDPNSRLLDLFQLSAGRDLLRERKSK